MNINIKPLYSHFANTFIALRNCMDSGNEEWKDKHGERIAEMLSLMPSGSGFDSPVQIEECNDSLLSFIAPFHHMDCSGGYSGWSHTRIDVVPSLAHGISVELTCVFDETEGYLYEEAEEMTSLVDETFLDYVHEVYDCLLRTRFELTIDGYKLVTEEHQLLAVQG